MIVIGAVFLVLAALAAVAAVVTARDVSVHLSGFGVDATTTVLGVFCAGAVAMLLLVLSLAAFRRAARKSRARRRELKQLRSDEATAPETRDDAMDRDSIHRDGDVNLRNERVPAGDAGAHVAHVDDGRERRYVAGDERY